MSALPRTRLLKISAGVFVGLVTVALTGWHWLDPVLGIAVALNILREGGHLV
jgi:divalent metal cation (Fe/Co/Zn/Cd) transporter